MITGKLKPTQEIVDKIFQCFYCKNCSDNCSAGVPVTDILTDARADLLDVGFEVKGTIVQIDEDLCSVCGVCVSLCKYEALSIEDDVDYVWPHVPLVLFLKLKDVMLIFMNSMRR
jgi:ferredoxin